jgi:hypothetical protein
MHKCLQRVFFRTYNSSIHDDDHASWAAPKDFCTKTMMIADYSHPLFLHAPTKRRGIRPPEILKKKQVTSAVASPHLRSPTPDATCDTGGGAGPPPEAAEHHDGAKSAPNRKNESFDSSTVEGALDEASSPLPRQECLIQAQVAQVAANAKDAVQLLVSHLQRVESGRVGQGGAHNDAASLKSIPSADVRECRRFHVRLLTTR